MNKSPAFSLVELSIVLVILGLLVGGILAGQSLIRASQLRGVSSEYSRFTTSMHAFRDKYFALPGDFSKAQDFWGVAAAGDACATTTTNDARTCNGDGNGLLDYANPPALASHEHFRFWQHLANAGLIEGRYTGIEGSTGNAAHSLPGVNVPLSKLGNGVWLARDLGNRSGHSELFDGAYGNTFLFGGPNGVNQPNSTILKPEDAWNIDMKSDDGNPATGRVTVLNRMSCTVLANGSVMTNDAAGAAAMTARYALATDTVTCGLLFRNLSR